MEVVDFILRSVDAVSRQELGRGLTDNNVHILDPFTGTGTFLNRLITLPDLITDKDLPRKYASELHANEIVLLAYYIAAVKIEQGYKSRRPDDEYQPFNGIVLTDTFETVTSDQQTMPTMSGNNQRAQLQAELPIQVIVGNPPWSAGQQDAGEDNPNIPHPTLERRIRDTYLQQSRANLRRSLYDLYKMSIRWATDRIGECGIIGFVTPNSFLDGNADSGLRACLEDEFSALYIFNLRGNARLSGDAWRREGGKVFGQASRVGVAISIMVRNSATPEEHCRIYYRDIGDYLTTPEKRAKLAELNSVVGIGDSWQRLIPDKNRDWINQGTPDWQDLTPLSNDSRGVATECVIAALHSPGIKTNRDPYLYSFDRAAVEERLLDMIDLYEQRRAAVAANHISLNDATENDMLDRIKWTGDLEDRLKRNTPIIFDRKHLRCTHYRPFVKQWLYFDRLCINRVYRIPLIFPNRDSPNEVLVLSGTGSARDFSAIATDTTPDLELVSKGQVFPRYTQARNLHNRFQVGREDFDDAHRRDTRPPAPVEDSGLSHIRLPEDGEVSQRTFDLGDVTNNPDAPDEYGQIDNITDWCLDRFREHYDDYAITKDDIWAYIYGVLHASDWRTKYANDLRKGLPRIPFAPDFWAFRTAGQDLIDVHLGYETCEPWLLDVETTGPESDDLYRIHTKLTWARVRDASGKLVDDRSILRVNERCRIVGIPDDAHHYSINGKTPLDWAIDRLRITKDNASGIVNDANKWHVWADEPYNLILHLQRLVRVSIETTRIVNALPPALVPN